MKVPYLVGLLLQWSVGLCDDVDDEIAMVKDSITKSGLGDIDSDFLKSLNFTYLALQKGGKLQLRGKTGKKHLDIEKVLKQHEKKSKKHPVWNSWVGIQAYEDPGYKVDQEDFSRAVSSLLDANPHGVNAGPGCYLKVDSEHKWKKKHSCNEDAIYDLLHGSEISHCPKSATCLYVREEDTSGSLRFATVAFGDNFDAVKALDCKAWTIAGAGSASSCSA